MTSDSIATAKTDRQVLSVSQLNRATKNLLETYLPRLWVDGEISNLATPSSGHWYFTLKDAKAQVRCAMFRGRNTRVRFKPEAGQKVLVRANATVYEGRGDYQLLVEHMEPAGFGDLQRQFELLKARLEAEGLFDAAHKQSLPTWPNKLGIVTSATGAAVHDILNVLKRRFPALPVLILPVAVQGAEAAGQIAKAIALANQEQLCDVLIVGRGGGSLEDLWAFNEEVVAQAIFASDIPVVSAVGHEIDFTIADFVADVRAPTPSAAAELISPNQAEIAQRLTQFNRSLTHHFQQRLLWWGQKLNHARARLQHPGLKLAAQAQQLDQLELRLTRALRNRLSQGQERLKMQQNRLTQASPQRWVGQQKQTVTNLSQRLSRAMGHQQSQAQARLGKAAELLHSVSPLNTLQRGYAIVLTPAGEAVRSAEQVRVGDSVNARLKHGTLQCEVTNIEDDN